MKRENTAWLAGLLPWRCRRKIELLRLKACRFATALDALLVQDGEPSASLTAVGDIAFGKDVGKILSEIGQFRSMVEPIFAGSDVRIGNLETVLTNAERADQSIGSLMRASPSAVSLLSAVNIDVVNLANNHARDCRVAGLLDCCELLDDHGIQHCGSGMYSAGAHSAARVDVAGLQVAVFGYCDNYRIEADESENVAPVAADDGCILEDIRSLRSQVDLVVIQLHWGYEFSFHPLISYRDRARKYAEAGADLVLCHHAHLPMGVEVWKKSIISHGMGNFVFPPDPYLRAGHPWTDRSYALRVFVNRSGVLRAEVIPVVITDSGVPMIATGSDRAEILGGVGRASSRLNDDSFLHWIERDRTLRETVGVLGFFLRSQTPVDREIALQLRSPCWQHNLKRLQTHHGKIERRGAEVLMEMAEASRNAETFARFAVPEKRNEIQTLLDVLRSTVRTAEDPAGRIP